MSISQSELDEVLLYYGRCFTVVVPHPNHTKSTYAGRGIARFLEDPGNRLHAHRVTDAHGQLVYSRDSHGVLHLGNAEQLVQKMRQERARTDPTVPVASGEPTSFSLSRTQTG